MYRIHKNTVLVCYAIDFFQGVALKVISTRDLTFFEIAGS